LTPLGEGISGKLGELAEWIEGNMAGILAAQGKPARVGQRL
jgi:hypothetical protein